MVNFGGRRRGYEEDYLLTPQDDVERVNRALQSQSNSQKGQSQIQRSNSPNIGLNALLSGLADSANNVGKSILGVLGTGIATIRDIGGTITGQGNNDSTKYREGKETDAFKRWLYGEDSKGNINYGKAAGEALDAASTLSNFVPGGGKLGANIAQGAMSGLANEYKEKGNDADLGNALKSAATGAVSGAATTGINNAISKKMGDLAEKQVNNTIGNLGQKALNAGRSNFVRGAVSGATGGAVGGGMATALNGGDLGQVLGNAVSIAGSGALSGGVTGSVMGLGAKAKDFALDKINNAYVDGKLPIPQTDLTPNAGIKKRLESSFESGLTGNFNEGQNWVGRLKPDDVSTANNIQDTLGRQNINKNGNVYLDNYNAAEHAQKRFAENPKKNTPENLANIAYNAMFGDGREVLPNNSSNPNSVAFINKNNPSGMTPIGIKNGENQILSVIPESKRKLNNFGNTVKDPEMGQAPDKSSAATTKIAQNTQNVNSKTSTAGKLRLKAAQALLDQYGTIDKPMARSANALENIQRVADAGFTKPADVENMINNITGSNGKVTKLTQKLVSGAKPVDTSSDINRIIDEQIALNGLSGTADEKAVRSAIEAQLRRLPSRREGSITGLDAPEDVFDTIKSLEKRSAELRGKSGNNYRLTTPERGDKAKVLDSVSSVLKDRLYGGANIENVLTPDVADDLKSLAPNNQKWANYVDNTIMKSGDVGELRSTVAPFVNMGKVIDNQYMNYGTYGQRVGDAANEGRRIAGMISKTPILGKLLGDIASSNVADRTRANIYGFLADRAEANPNQAMNTATTTQSSVPSNSITNNGASTPLTQNRIAVPQNMLNLIGRNQGIINGSNVQDVLQQTSDSYTRYPGGVSEQPANQNATLEDTMKNIAMQGSLGGSRQNATGGYERDHGKSSTGYDNPLLDQLDNIGNAMQLALNAGDIDSYSKLAGLYNDALGIYKLQQSVFNPQTTSTKLTDSQRKASAAMDLLNDLDTQKADFGSMMSNSPFGGLVGLFGGNEYANSSKALESAIGYLQSGAQVSDKEREAIRQAYIPQYTDSDAVKKRKLAAARQLIQNYMNGTAV
nr:MAG TPA: hypothetical protein [Caudoviricetes sp.]